MFPTDREAFSPPRKKSKIIFDIIKKKLTLKYPCGTIIRLSRKGDSEDIDKYTAKKFAVLKNYIDKYHLHGGIVRQDKQSGELCICTNNYSDDIKSDSWQLLSDVL